MTRLAPLRLILGRGSSTAYVPVGGRDSPAVLETMPFTLVDCVRGRTGSGDISSTENSAAARRENVLEPAQLCGLVTTQASE
jgi:hypothetical protein